MEWRRCDGGGQRSSLLTFTGWTQAETVPEEVGSIL